MHTRYLPLLPLLAVLLLHCASDEQSLGANQSDSSRAGSAGSGSAGSDAGGNAGVAGGTSTTSRRICDGSDGLTLSYTSRGGGLFEPGRYVEAEIGSGLFVDGHCQYWVTSPGVEPYYGNALYPIHTGTLTAAQEQQLASALGYDQWPQLYGKTYVSGADAPSTVAFDRTDSFSCEALCQSITPAEKTAFAVQLAELEGALYEQGSAMTGPMRIRAVTVSDEQATSPSSVLLPWTLATPLASLLSTGDDFGGDAPLITDANDLIELRKIRDAMLTLRTESPGKQVFVEQTTPLLRAQIYFRDTIPLENEHGLIPAP